MMGGAAGRGRVRGSFECGPALSDIVRFLGLTVIAMQPQGLVGAPSVQNIILYVNVGHSHPLMLPAKLDLRLERRMPPYSLKVTRSQRAKAGHAVLPQRSPSSIRLPLQMLRSPEAQKRQIAF